MPFDLTNIVPGQLPEPVFELLVKRAGITSEPVIAAVRDHLVCGLGKQEAWLKHGINKGSFSSRTTMLVKEAAALEGELKILLPFMIPTVQTEGLNMAAQELSSALLRFKSLTSELEASIQDALKLTERECEAAPNPEARN